MIEKLILFYRTLSYLKPIQIYGRIFFKLKYIKIDNSVAPKLSKRDKACVLFARRSVSLIDRTTWKFLAITGNLKEIGWQNSIRSKLWRYNQHYFDDLTAYSSHARKNWHKDLIERWIIDNSPGKGIGWDPYPTSIRIINWVKWSLIGNTLSKRALDSLATQACWLEKRVEWHLLGNHLFSNAKALIFVGLFFEGREAQRWFLAGMKILKKEFSEQILPDGAQFELSTMYHALALEDILDLINICNSYYTKLSSNQKIQLTFWKKIIPNMLNWLLVMSHPDGKIAFFNDSAFGIAPDNRELINYAKNLGFKRKYLKNNLINLKNSGYVRLQCGPCVLLADLAEIGPKYLPGHAHADSLSFELSINKNRVFVNSGTSDYTFSPERIRQRSTLAHNTVSIEGKNSSEIWSSFRVGARAHVIERKVTKKSNCLLASGTHNGFAKKMNGLLHSREFKLEKNQLEILDSLSIPASAEARYHLHPKCNIKLISKTQGIITINNQTILNFKIHGATDVFVESVTWHPKFGLSCITKCLVLRFIGLNCKITLLWK